MPSTPFYLPETLGPQTAVAPSIMPRRMVGTIERLCSGSYVVLRTAAGAYDENGRYTAGSTSTFSINASIQPVSGRDLQRLPEGLRTLDLKSVWSRTQLFTAEAPAGMQADVITVGPHSYQVQTVLDWFSNAGYFKYIIQKVGQ